MSKIKIAYLLLVHKNANQVNIFINQLLNYGDCDIFIHVDCKNSFLESQLIRTPQIHIISKYNVRWGSFEIVKAAMELMRLAKASGNDYSHVYLGSGQDLLVKKGLYEYLDSKPNITFIRINKRITENDRESARYRISWPKKLMVRNDMHFYRFIRIFLQFLCKTGIVLFKNNRVYKDSLLFYEGRTWFIAPIAVMDYIVEYVNKHVDFYDYWEDSLASDLMFFQTIIMNSPFREKIEDELMYVKFGKTFKTMNHSVTITNKDVCLIEAGNFFCARKFELEEKEAIDYFINKIK